MNITQVTRLTVLFAGLVGLSACSKEILFGSKEGPDAFLTVSNAPLTPLQRSDLNAPLPTPKPGYILPEKRVLEKTQSVTEIFNGQKQQANADTERAVSHVLQKKLIKGEFQWAKDSDLEELDRELSAVYAKDQKNLSILEEWAGSKGNSDPVIDKEAEQSRLDNISKNKSADSEPKRYKPSKIKLPISDRNPKVNRNNADASN